MQISSENDFDRAKQPVVQPRGFLSYAHEDWETAERLFADLVDRGHRLWFDRRDFQPEQGVDAQVLNAIRESAYFILLLTPVSASKVGYIRREIRLSLDMIREFGLGDAFVIPVRAQLCQPLQDELGGLSQFVDLFPDWNHGVEALSAAIPTGERTDLLQAGPHAIQAALCNPGYIERLSGSLRDRSSIGVTLDNFLSKLRGLDDSVVSHKISAMRHRLADFAACMELHFVHKCGELDQRTVCRECGARGAIVHGSVDLGGKSPMDYNDNYVSWCSNCYWADYDFEVDYLGQGPLTFDYATNTYR